MRIRQKTSRRSVRLLVSCTLLLISSMLAGCALHDRVAPVNDTFLKDVDMKSKIENLPFDQAWVRAGFDGRRYKKLYIKPVRIDFLAENEAWVRSSSAIISSFDDYYAEAKVIGGYFRTQLIKNIREYPQNRIEVVDAPGDDVITLEIALTELEFSHPVARAASLAAPIPGTGAALSTVTDPHVAFAARFYDPSGRLSATAADRKFPPARILDLNKLTVTSSPREVVALWAGTMAEAMNKGRFSKTDDTSRISWWIW